MNKKNIFFSAFFLLSSFFLVSCGGNEDGGKNSDPPGEIQLVDVTFFNESGYAVLVHRDSFYGPKIEGLGMLAIGDIKTVPLRPSDNNQPLTVFAMEYLVYPPIEDVDNEHGEIYVSCTDANVQPAYVIKAGMDVIQIPHPNLVCKSGFVRITNNHNLPIFVRRGQILPQAGNNALVIAPYKQGIYRIDGSPDEGQPCQYYDIMVSSNNIIKFSDFIGEYIAKNAWILSFEFDGSTIKKTGEQKIIFNKGVK